MELDEQVLHIDFQRVDESTRLRKKVPLHFSGEENSPAVKTDKALVSHVQTELEIECLLLNCLSSSPSICPAW